MGCVTTYHNDPARDGVNGNETVLTPAIVSGSTFTLLKNFDNLDGLVYAQPLYLSGVTMAASTSCAGSNKSIAIVATENNTIYVYDVTPGDTIQECYHKNVNAAGENAIPFTDLGGNSPECNNLIPQEGISGTPAIDTAVSPPALYFVAAVKTATSWDFKLHVMQVSSGNPGSGSPFYLSSRITLQPGGGGFSAINQNQRPGVALFRPAVGNKVNLYIGFGSHCDSTPYQGYVAGFQYVYGNPASFNNLGVFASENVTGGSQGGIWMSGAAPAVDSNGNVYVATGNGAWNGQPNSATVPTALGESVVQLQQSGSSLTAVDYYTPNNYSYLNNGSSGSNVCVVNNTGSSCPSQYTFQLTGNDYDLGSAGVTLFKPTGSGFTALCGSSNGELVAGGKEGVLYGICYNPSPGTLGTMGGLDSCGYNFTGTCTSNLNTVAAKTACTQSASPTPGSIAQCFWGVPNLSDQSQGKDTGNRGTPAFWGGSTSSPQNYLYVAGTADVLRAYQFLPGGTFNLTGAQDTVPNPFPYPGATPSVSWNGSGSNPDPTTGLVWATSSGPYGKYTLGTDTTTKAGPATLFGYKAMPDNLGATLTNEFRSDKITLPPGTNPGPGAVKFTTPTIAAGLVFVGGGEANPVYYAPGQTTTPNANCTPSAAGGHCSGGFYIYGTTTR